MTVEVDGVFYNNVISITQVAPNKATLVMPNKSVTVPIFIPIQIIGSPLSNVERLEEKKDMSKSAK
jgi:hypothetical protein